MAPRPLALGIAALTLVLAGCVTEGPAAGAGEDATLESDARGDLRMRGVTLHAEIEPGTERVWTVEVGHGGAEGSAGYRYREGCGNPWTVAMKDAAGNDVDWHEPMAQCLGFQNKVLSPGEAHEHRWAWDGRIWVDDRYQDAAGDHRVTFRFQATQDGDDATVTGSTTVRAG